MVAELLAPPDGLAPYRPTLLALRWGTVGLGIALAYDRFQAHPAATAAASIVLVALGVARTIWPVHDRGDHGFVVAVAIDILVAVAAVGATGGWSSPLAFSLLVPPMIAGFARGFVTALVTCSVAVAAVGASDLVADDTATSRVADWVAMLVLVSVLAGLVNRVTTERDREKRRALDRIGRLADANLLLNSLHRLAQVLPSSLDLDETLDATVARLREQFDPTHVTVLLLDETDGAFTAARHDGAVSSERLSVDDLPAPLRRAVAVRSTVRETDTTGLVDRARSGLYGILPARGSMIGVLAIEHEDAAHFSERDAELLEGFVESAGLAIDNARVFARLRTVGADEERTRIARELHDRVGQSLAFLGVELDRIVKAGERGDDLLPAVEQLRGDVRGVIREVRDTLYDLRADVSDTRTFETVLEGFLDRVRDRSGIAVLFDRAEPCRLPLPQERELLRITQEAVTNVERHAGATALTVRWRCDNRRAELEVVDNGHGFGATHPARLDSFGLVGMRERAASIGATLDVSSTPGRGTRVRCVVARTA
ncbi:MAG: histidine kinase [Acidimicrobiales bacterium]